MTKNKQIFVLGAIAFSSLLIPPNFGINFFGIGLEDIPLVGIFVFLFLNFLSNKTKNINKVDYFWAGITLFFPIFTP